MAEALQDLGDHIAAKLGAAITGATHAYGELTLEAKAAEIVRVLTFLRDDPDCGFVCFIDICGADYPDARAALRRGLSPAVAATRTAASA